MVEMLQCSKGHRFPVNRKKHRTRKYRICPHPGCHEKVQIRKRIRRPNLEWPKQKDEQKQLRRERKEKRRKKGDDVSILLPTADVRMQRFALASLIAKQERERKQENEGKKG